MQLHWLRYESVPDRLLGWRSPGVRSPSGPQVGTERLVTYRLWLLMIQTQLDKEALLWRHPYAHIDPTHPALKPP